MTTYQRMSDVPKKGRTEYELRLESLFGRLHIAPLVNQVYCFACRSHFSHDGYSYPSACRNCFLLYNEPGLYIMPDFILQNGERKGVLYVNGGVHEKPKQLKKDKLQVSQLRQDGLKVFVINNDEIENMTNATLIAYLKSVYRAVADDALYEAMYKAEREYPSLR